MYVTAISFMRCRTRLTCGCHSADTAIAIRTGVRTDREIDGTTGAMIVTIDQAAGIAPVRGDGRGSDHQTESGDAAAAETETTGTGETTHVTATATATEHDAMPLLTRGQKHGGKTAGRGTGIGIGIGPLA